MTVLLGHLGNAVDEGQPRDEIGEGVGLRQVVTVHDLPTPELRQERRSFFRGQRRHTSTTRDTVARRKLAHLGIRHASIIGRAPRTTSRLAEPSDTQPAVAGLGACGPASAEIQPFGPLLAGALVSGTPSVVVFAASRVAVGGLGRSQTETMATSDLQLLERELAEMIVRELNLEDVIPEQIGVDEPLFGQGLGLDSIDALELAMAVQRTYGVRIDPDDAEQRRVMESVRKLAAYVGERRGLDGGV